MQERIMVYGGTGSGKSTGWLTLARQQPENTFYCVDTDKSSLRLLNTEFKDVLEKGNVKVLHCRTWESCKQTLESLIPTIKENDWLIIDKIDPLWSFLQNWYTLKVFNKNIDEYFLQLRKSVGGGSKLESFKGWTDWAVINSTYQSLIDPVMYDYDYNIYITAKSKDYDPKGELEDAELKESFSVVGYQPEGEKRNADRCHTILFLNHDSFGYYMTTVKDRGRQQVKEYAFTNFAETYQKIIDNIQITEAATPKSGARAEAKADAEKISFSKWLDKNHVLHSDAVKILEIESLDAITDYKSAQNKIKEAKGIL